MALAGAPPPNPRNERQLRELGYPSCTNFRDLGGYLTADGRHRVRYGQLYRHGKQAQLSAAERAHLRGLGLRTVVDFRADREVAASPAHVPPSAQLLRIPMQDPAGGPRPAAHRRARRLDDGGGPLGFAFGGAMRRHFAAGDLTPARGYQARGMPRVFAALVKNRHRLADFARFLRVAAADDRRPLSFMCNGGKDRTGLAAVFLLTALGVPEHTVIADFMLSNRYNRAGEQVQRRMAGMAAKWSPTGDLSPYPPEQRRALADALMSVIGVDEGNLAAALGVMKAAHGSVRGFMRAELGVTDEPCPHPAAARL